MNADERMKQAAPDLLAALQAFIALDANFQKPIDHVIAVANDPKSKSRTLAKAVLAARMAISKATGAHA